MPCDYPCTTFSLDKKGIPYCLPALNSLKPYHQSTSDMELGEASRKGKSHTVQMKWSMVSSWDRDSLTSTQGDACAKMLGARNESHPKAIQLYSLQHQGLGKKTRWFSLFSYRSEGLVSMWVASLFPYSGRGFDFLVFCLCTSGISTQATLYLIEMTGQCHGSYPVHQRMILGDPRRPVSV